MRFGFKVQGFYGSYQVESHLGEGGFANVFRAASHDARKVAIKYLQDGLDEDAKQRFDREMRILKGFRHPYVIELVDYGVDDQGKAWYAMPEMNGGALANLLNNDRTWEQVVTITHKVAQAVAAYHALGPHAVHRDIKLENVLLNENSEPRLADFGVARCPELTGSSMTQNANGTAPYMAPEVWRNSGNQASDVYALGIMFWELVNGNRHTVPNRPPRLLNAAPGFEALDTLYKAMTADDWRKRPTATQVVEQLGAFLAYLRRAPKPQRRESAQVASVWPWVVGGILVVGAGVALAAVFSDDD